MTTGRIYEPETVAKLATPAETAGALLACAGPAGDATDPIAIARRLGVAVWTSELSVGVSGIIARERRGGDVSLFLDRTHPAARLRVTAAHELGHFLAHLRGTDPDGPFFYRCDSDLSCAEQDGEFWASEFAVELLMPVELVTDALQSGSTPVDMTREFMVPLDLVVRRLVGIRHGA